MQTLFSNSYLHPGDIWRRSPYIIKRSCTLYVFWPSQVFFFKFRTPFFLSREMLIIIFFALKIYLITHALFKPILTNREIYWHQEPVICHHRRHRYHYESLLSPYLSICFDVNQVPVLRRILINLMLVYGGERIWRKKLPLTMESYCIAL